MSAFGGVWGLLISWDILGGVFGEIVCLMCFARFSDRCSLLFFLVCCNNVVDLSYRLGCEFCLIGCLLVWFNAVYVCFLI